jgi:diguanylate cyclase (GGDEF)-like protein
MRIAMSVMDNDLLVEVLRHAPDAVAVVEGTEAGGRIVYANATLALLLQRQDEWPLGRNLGEIESSGACGAAKVSSAPVSLVCADGTRIGCERFESQLTGDRRVVYYRPMPKLAFEASQALPSLAGNSTGLATREHLMEVLRRDWSVAQRDSGRITVMRFDLDAFRSYIEIFGRMAADNVLRQVGKTIGSAMRRASDVVARFDDDEFVVLGIAMEPPSAALHAEQILGRVRALAVHHPRSPTGRYLTMSCGIVTGIPSRGSDCDSILEAAARALIKAKADGGNRVVGGELK